MSRGPALGRSERAWATARNCVLALGALVGALPLVFVAVTALRSPRDYFDRPLGLPGELFLGNFQRALELNIGRWFLNSLIVTGGAVLLATVLAVLGGYALVRLKFRGSGVVLSGIVTLMLIPPVVLLVPLFVAMSSARLVGSPLPVILIYAALTFPFSVFMMVRFMDAIPAELYESAVIDGASHLQTLRQIVVPLARPVLTTIVIVNTLYAWNELLIASVFLQAGDSLTLQAGLAQLDGRFQTDVPLVLAGAVISLLPVAVAIALGQRQFVQGMVEGSVKG